MNKKFNNTIVETNGVRTVAGGGTGTTTLGSLRYSLEVLPLSGGTVTGNITLSGNILPYTSGRGSFVVIVSDPISILTTANTLSSVYQCPVGFRFLPEEISYTFDTISFTGNPNTNSPAIVNPMVRLYNSNSTTVSTDLGPQLTFPINGGSTQALNRWFRSSNTSTTVIGRPMLIGGTAGSDIAYLRIDTAYVPSDISNRYIDLKIKVILSGYLIKN